ncbi:MAG TPA: hypothetical protein VGC42_13165 [Kofleriaceae bacterium]
MLIGLTTAAAAQPKPAETRPAPPPSNGPTPAPAALADRAKALSGTWSCKGQSLDRTNKLVDSTATMKIKLDLDGWWLHTSYEAKGKEPFHFEQFVTYDEVAKKWKSIMAETGGEWNVGESDGPQNGKLDFAITSHLPGWLAQVMGGKTETQFRDHEDASDPKAGLKLTGEVSFDGKAWTTVYNMTCKK